MQVVYMYFCIEHVAFALICVLNIVLMYDNAYTSRLLYSWGASSFLNMSQLEHV